MRRVAMTISAVLLVAACEKSDEPVLVNETVLDNSVSNEMKAADPTLPTRLAMSGQQFANMAAASNAFEIAESKLAAQQAIFPATRDFATAMIDAHGRSSTTLRQTAAGAKPAITPDPALSSAQQAKIDALAKLTGNAVDDQYLRDQIEAHEAMLGALADYSAHGDVDELRGFANEAAPEVQAHLTMARNLPR